MAPAASPDRLRNARLPTAPLVNPANAADRRARFATPLTFVLSIGLSSASQALEPGQFVIPLDVRRLAIAEGTLGAIGCLRLAFARHTDGRRGPGDAADSGQLQEVDRKSTRLNSSH